MNSQLGTVFLVVLPVFFVAILGVLIRRVNWLNQNADQSLLKITVNLLAPCLILDSILQNQALKDPANLFIPPFVGFGTVVIGMVISWYVARIFKLGERKVIGTFALCTGLFNYGYVPIPLARELFGKETVGVLMVHNVGVEISMWSAGIVLLAGHTEGKALKKIFNAPVMAILVGLPINYFWGDRFIPAFVLGTIHMLAACAIPMGLLLIGATVADYIHDFHSASGWKVMFFSCLLRLLVLPFLMLLLARYLPLTVELKRVVVLQAAMPSAVFPIVMARHYGGDASTSLRVVIGTSLVGFLTIPLWINFGLHWIFPN
jgi:predicted permease